MSASPEVRDGDGGGDGDGKGDPQTKNDFFEDGGALFIQNQMAQNGMCGGNARTFCYWEIGAQNAGPFC